jgi:adenylate kinase
VYSQQTRPLVDYYAQWAQVEPAAAPKYRTVSGVGKVEEIARAVLAALG